jgi:hypothetical protein
MFPFHVIYLIYVLNIYYAREPHVVSDASLVLVFFRPF